MRFLRRLRALAGRKRLERDMDEEMRLHLELETADLIRSGVPEAEARRKARLAFGGVDRFKEEGRDARGVRVVEDFARDVRLAVRQMRHSLGFSTAALVTLALGIGATTAQFSMLRAVWFHPLPFDNSDELVMLEQCGRCLRMAIGNYVTVRDESRTLSAVAAFIASSPVLRGAEKTDVLVGSRVTVELFTMTGVRPLLGRVFTPADTMPQGGRVSLISESAWRARFGADSSIIGRPIILDGVPTTVVGIIPTRYAFPAATEIWTLLSLDARTIADRYWTDYTVLGRIQLGRTIADVATELEVITGRLATAFPDAMRRQKLTVRASRYWNGQILVPIAIFMTAVGMVLLIACTNLAGLLIARLTSRSREIAVRAAMGAGRSRLARQLLAETLLVSVLGSVLGVGTAWAMIGAMRGSIPVDAIAGWSALQMDWRVLALAIAMGAVTGSAIGIGPALRFSRPDLVAMLKDGARGSVGGAGRARRTLVVAQVAFSIMLLVAAGLLTKTAVNVYRADIGIRLDHVLTMRLRYPATLDSLHKRPADFYDRLVAEVERLPNVERAATVSFVPFTGYTSFGFQVEGRPPAEPSDRPSARMQAATAGYFDVMGIRVVSGRGFDRRDGEGSQPVVVISERTARRHFTEKGEDPLGRALILEGRRFEIVGVTREVYHFGPQAGNQDEVYYLQSQWPRGAVTLAVKTKGDPASVAPDVTRRIHAFERDLGVSRVAPMSAVADEWLGRYRVMAGLMLAFAAVALLISAIGLYGVISYSVAQRTREFGIRLALGAAGRDLLGLVLRDGVRLVAVGVAVGLVAALGLTRAMRAVLYGVGTADPVIFVSVTVTLGLLAVGASLAPATRAAKVDPMTSLRAD